MKSGQLFSDINVGSTGSDTNESVTDNRTRNECKTSENYTRNECNFKATKLHQGRGERGGRGKNNRKSIYLKNLFFKKEGFCFFKETNFLENINRKFFFLFFDNNSGPFLNASVCGYGRTSYCFSLRHRFHPRDGNSTLVV